MKKIILMGIIGAAILIPNLSAEAVSNQWWMGHAKTYLTGQMYTTNGLRNQANASSTASKQDVNVKVKIYAKQGSTNDPESWKERSGKKTAWVESTSWKPDWWGSGHTTSGFANDPWEWLNLYVGNM